MQVKPGVLYVVATPIGNLTDISERAISTLRTVDKIVAENPRHSGKLLQHYGINTPVMALHEHNELAELGALLTLLEQGNQLALISDAGTPLISDPGYPLVRAATKHGFDVIAIPGACALIAALSVSGLASDRFFFVGFLPAKPIARQHALQYLCEQTGTLIFYEAPHRVCATLQDMAKALGEQREAVLLRELTKIHETRIAGTLATLAEDCANNPSLKGEMVILVAGFDEKRAKKTLSDEVVRTLTILQAELPLRQAVALCAKITQCHKNTLYQFALRQKNLGSE